MTGGKSDKGTVAQHLSSSATTDSSSKWDRNAFKGPQNIASEYEDEVHKQAEGKHEIKEGDDNDGGDNNDDDNE